MIDDEAMTCLELRSDMSAELCLQNYEAQLGDQLILNDDPTDLYFGRKRAAVSAEGKPAASSDEIPYDYGSINPKEYFVDKKESTMSYTFGEEDFTNYVCGNIDMIFYSNPKGGLKRNAVNRTLYETQFSLECHTFEMYNTEKHFVAHFTTPDLRLSSLPDVYVDRASGNQQYFQTTFGADLNFVTAISQIMYSGYVSKGKFDAYKYTSFIGNVETTKIVQIAEQVINY